MYICIYVSMYRCIYVGEFVYTYVGFYCVLGSATTCSTYTDIILCIRCQILNLKHNAINHEKLHKIWCVVQMVYTAQSLVHPVLCMLYFAQHVVMGSATNWTFHHVSRCAFGTPGIMEIKCMLHRG